MTEIMLAKPFEFCGETYEKIEMDFDKLTGADVEAIEEELFAETKTIVFREDWNKRYQRYLAAKASGVPNDMIEALPAREYKKIVKAASDAISKIETESGKLLNQFDGGNDVITMTLSKTAEYENETYETIEMDFGGLTGRDIEAVEDEVSAAENIRFSPSISKRYQRYLAAKAAGVPSEMVKALPMRDYNMMVEAARYFLFSEA